MIPKDFDIPVVVGFDLRYKCVGVYAHLREDMFTDGVYVSEYMHVAYIGTTRIKGELPEGFDPLAPQIKAIEAEIKEVKFRAAQRVTALEQQKQELLALEHTS